jgi:hypothetical protein
MTIVLCELFLYDISHYDFFSTEATPSIMTAYSGRIHKVNNSLLCFSYLISRISPQACSILGASLHLACILELVTRMQDFQTAEENPASYTTGTTGNLQDI